MESKEMLQEIEEARNYDDVKYLINKYFPTIKKDIEILEIFKDYLHFNVYICFLNDKPMYFLKIMGCDIFITKEIYNKLKEWLDGK